MKNLSQPIDLLNGIATCCLPPPPNPLGSLIHAFATHPAINDKVHGANMIRNHLQTRGVAEDAIDRVVEEYKRIVQAR